MSAPSWDIVRISADAPSDAGATYLGTLWAESDTGKLYICSSLSPITFDEIGAGYASEAESIKSGAELPGTPSLADIFYLTTDECVYIAVTE